MMANLKASSTMKTLPDYFETDIKVLTDVNMKATVNI